MDPMQAQQPQTPQAPQQPSGTPQMPTGTPGLPKLPGLNKIPGMNKMPKGAVGGVIAVVVLLIVGGIAKVVIGNMASFATRKAIEAGTGVSVDSQGQVTKIKDKDGNTVEVKPNGDNGGTYTYTGKNGEQTTMQVSGGNGTATLPKNFPSDFPVVADGTVTSSLSTNTSEDGTAYSVTWTTTQEVSAVNDFFQKTLVEKGWRITSSAEINGSYIIAFERGPEDAPKKDGGQIIISTEEGKTSVGLTLQFPPAPAPAPAPAPQQ
jgi:hypothetical protein